jgi:hypothetical protein
MAESEGWSGALILAAAGIPEGVPATTHWLVQPMSATLGAEPRPDRRAAWRRQGRGEQHVVSDQAGDRLMRIVEAIVDQHRSPLGTSRATTD